MSKLPLRPPCRIGRLKGQALVLFVVFAAVLAMGVVLMFDTGQTVNKKVHLDNASDATAYSLAVQQARVMNYAAYMNRARIANEVTMAQLVSASSWQSMLHSHTVIMYRIAQMLSWIPYVGPVLRTIAQVGEYVMQGSRLGMTPTATAAIPVLSTMNTSYAASTDLMLNIAAGVHRGMQTADEVLAQNDGTAELSDIGKVLLAQQLGRANSSGSAGLFERYTRHDRRGMNRYRNVVMASRDGFSVERNREWRLPLIGNGIFPCPHLLCRRFGIEVRGGTDMVEYDRWAGVDGKELRYQYFRCGWTGCSWRWRRYRFGFGGAQAVAQGMPSFNPGIRSGGRDQRGAGWYHERENRTYARYGNALGLRVINGNLITRCPSVNCPQYMMGNRPSMGSGFPNRRRDGFYSGYQGLRPYHDVKSQYGRSPDGADAGPIFTAYVHSKREDPGDDDLRPDAHRTSEMIDGLGGFNGSRLELTDSIDRITALSTAQTYFYRPPRQGVFRRVIRNGWNGGLRHDDQLEHGSLFSPYWQARLIETPPEVYLYVGADTLSGIEGS